MSTTPLEAAYFSAVMVAGALAKHGHAAAPQALELKHALARGLTHPDTLREADFQTVWNARKQFSDLNLDGEPGELVAKHAQILTETNL
ncbi:MAG: hypothetical protein H6922_05165 [Pseudomonadaceae bacterium]|nr:hypothetical protein [Pseudomonadaceae bacterium]